MNQRARHVAERAMPEEGRAKAVRISSLVLGHRW